MIPDQQPTRSIQDLLDKKDEFFVEDYQRGFKWTDKKIIALLEDINGFEFDEKKSPFYCLQPIIVTRSEEPGNPWELIDGQQRLTSIFIIISYLKEKNVPQTPEPFNIQYRTRKGSAHFLKEISRKGITKASSWDSFKNNNRCIDNIDNYHFFEAYKVIDEWFFNFSKRDEDQKGNFLKKLLIHTKVIWYVVSGDASPKTIFMRINSGKIHLTNAELVKALFLKGSTETEVLKLKQTEIAQEWDRIEYALQEDAFWYFINKKPKNNAPSPTRIDLIFNIITGKFKATKKEMEEEYYSFQKYSQILEEKNVVGTQRKKKVDDQWEIVKDYFLRLQEWYEDSKLYHLIGFLITRNISEIEDLIAESKALSKPLFEEEITARIRECFKDYNIDNLYYNVHKDKEKLKNILLLFNIQTLINSNSNTRFPFDRYKESNWSLEHIHAQNSDVLTTNDELEIWRKTYFSLLSGSIENDSTASDLYKKLLPDVWSCMTVDKKKQLQKDLEKDITAFFGDHDKGEEMHGIENLALLDKDTNSSLGNDIFPIKRKRIIDIDKENKSIFIPVATKNVFLKYYSSNSSQIKKWDSNDRSDYVNEIKKVLDDAKYLTKRSLPS